MIRGLLTLIVIVIATGPAWAQDDRYEEQAIAYAKRIPVSKLDRSLGDQLFIEWFSATVGPHVRIAWEVNDCGEQTGTSADAGRDFPSCVEARAQLSDGREVVIRIAVGTFVKGITGHPAINAAFVQQNDAIRDIRKLGELAEALNNNAR